MKRRARCGLYLCMNPLLSLGGIAGDIFDAVRPKSALDAIGGDPYGMLDPNKTDCGFDQGPPTGLIDPTGAWGNEAPMPPTGFLDPADPLIDPMLAYGHYSD